MKKSKLTLVFVIALACFVPQIASSQANPGAKAETSESKAAQTASKTTSRKATEPIQLAADAPASYVVVKGDTLWDISGRFLKEPWRWPEIWNMNRDQIKDPHWIYPGDIIKLSFDAYGNPRLSFGSGGSLGGDDSRLQPRVRVDTLAQAIPSIPSRVITPFLSLPLVIEEGALANAPRIISAEDERVVIGAGNIAYALGLQQSQGVKWQIYRPGKVLKGEEGEILGYEANYLGEAKVLRFGETSTIEILRSTQEINRGDRLTPTMDTAVPSYSPRPPSKIIAGTVISVLNGVDTGAQYSIVALNLGKREGLEVGHVLATLRKGATVSAEDPIGQANKWTTTSTDGGTQSSGSVKLPDERNGLVFVFRVFEKVSYALVMSTRRPIELGDIVQTP
ncbi:MAG: LysM peptidoglycan-binding domain-containing protein [Burkholderiales bacterium]|nr:LysM peptidoglycan-binding domain-containing protein [Burkholderiales bacterium]